MLIYAALLIPIITALVLYLKFKHETVWWEFLIPTTASLIFIIIMKLSIEYVQVGCDEYWGSTISKVEYYEDWNEYIHRRCTRSCGKNCTTTYDCSYVQYHPPKWVITTSTDEEILITKAEYDRLVKHFGNSTFIDLYRHYHTNDGDKYVTVWYKHQEDKVIPATTKHRYENRVKAADHSIFHLGEVSKEMVDQYKLFNYPDIYDEYKQSALLGDSTLEAIKADSILRRYNGILGHDKEVKIFLLIHKNQPLESGLYQEWYWCGGNMNEFIVSVGVNDDNKIDWCKVISWTPNELLKSTVRRKVEALDSLDHAKLVHLIGDEVKDNFVRKDFKEFDYITVDPPMWSVVLTFVLTILLNVGLSFWIVNNEFDRKWFDFRQKFNNRGRRF